MLKISFDITGIHYSLLYIQIENRYFKHNISNIVFKIKFFYLSFDLFV